MHNLQDLTEGTTYDNIVCCDYPLADLVRNLMINRGKRTLTEFKVHLGVANPHNSRSSCECVKYFGPLWVPHPTYNPDRVPSDFSRFGSLKSKLQEIAMRSRPELFSAIGPTFDKIFKETFLAIWKYWIKRLRWSVRNKGSTTTSPSEEPGWFLDLEDKTLCTNFLGLDKGARRDDSPRESMHKVRSSVFYRRVLALWTSISRV
jgi:hypothetical protein